MLKQAASKKSHKKHPTSDRDWKCLNQLRQTPDIIEKRVANIEMRRKFLEGQNIRNNASEKQKLMNYRIHHNVDQMLQGRARDLARVRDQALADRIAQIDANPSNRSYMQMNPMFAQPLIGEQPRYFLT